jgi:hypothetical protein
MLCSLHDQNDHILQLLQVPPVCYGALHKYQPNIPLVANCTPHDAYFRMEYDVTIGLVKRFENKPLSTL